MPNQQFLKSSIFFAMYAVRCIVVLISFCETIIRTDNTNFHDGLGLSNLIQTQTQPKESVPQVKLTGVNHGVMTQGPHFRPTSGL